jgi:hypothetical protein
MSSTRPVMPADHDLAREIAGRTQRRLGANHGVASTMTSAAPVG